MASFKIMLYKWKQYQDGRYPIILQLIHNRKRKVVTLRYTATKDEWIEELGRFSPKMKSYKLKNQVLESEEQKAEHVMAELRKENKQFSFELFLSRFTTEDKSHVTVFDFYETIINELKSIEKVNTAIIYQSSYNVIRKFRDNRDFSFYEIDYEFLKQYETFLFARKNTGGGVHLHMRTLRALYNEAKNRNIIEESYYPFSRSAGKGGYSLAGLKSNASPRALSAHDLDLFKNFNLQQYPQYAESYYFFMFSYYGRGINFGDMAQLTKSNIYNDRIIYFRAKTGRPLNLKLNENLQTIISYFDNTESDYVFPILNSFHKTETQKKNRIHKRLRALNVDLKEIAQILGIKVTLTTYVARHSYATTLMRQGAMHSMIGRVLGHTDLSITNVYLAQFADEELDKTDELL